MIFDTHSHYNLEPLFENWQLHWQKAQGHGVNQSVVIGVTVETSQRAVDLATQNPQFRAAVAIHPSEYQYLIEDVNPSAAEISELIAAEMKELTSLAKNTKVVAIGETGLDYFRLPTATDTATAIKLTQQQALTAHLELASATKLPIILHVRDQGDGAYQDIIKTLKAQNQPPSKFVLHCVSGPESYIKEALELGAYMGIAGNVTYKSAEHIRNLVRLAPPERLLLETDAPFLPPQEFRGKTCEPWMISLTAAFVSDELNLDLEQLYQNAKTFFAF